jgi:hypothetical protein
MSQEPPRDQAAPPPPAGVPPGAEVVDMADDADDDPAVAAAVAARKKAAQVYNEMLTHLTELHSKYSKKRKGVWCCAKPIGQYGADRLLEGVKLEMACTDGQGKKYLLSAKNYSGTVNQHARHCATCRPVRRWAGGGALEHAAQSGADL